LLKDAGLPVAAPVAASAVPARTAPDADCGPRALLLLCQKLGVKTSLATLQQTAGTTAQGTTLAGLQQAAQKLGLQAEGVQVSRDALPDTALPAIAWMNRDHYVALLALSGSGESATATIHDPNKAGEETLSQEQLLQRCGGYLLLVHR
jgi:ABC-type bacteriocin/lantibiotic exporter with double-glycine peptidase domain